jgi:hypothetical protein
MFIKLFYWRNVEMKNKTLEITLFSNDIAHCLVDEEKYKIGLAKTVFGDWDKLGDYKENQRRKFRGNAHYKFKVKTIQVKEDVIDDTPDFDETEIEDEFPGLQPKLDDEQPEDEQIELNDEKCSAITKSGKQCKMDKAEGCDECNFHKDKK